MEKRVKDVMRRHSDQNNANDNRENLHLSFFRSEVNARIEMLNYEPLFANAVCKQEDYLLTYRRPQISYLPLRTMQIASV